MTNASRAEAMDSQTLSVVSALAQRATSLERDIETLETALKSAKEELRAIVEDSLPVSMAELGVLRLQLDDGSSIKVEEAVYAGIPSQHEQAALSWLREHELGDVIKNEVTASFGRGEDDAAAELTARLSSAGTVYKQKESVHSSTLRALARERIAAGDPLPEDLFGVRIINRAIIKRG